MAIYKRQSDNGSDAQTPAVFKINTRVGLCVITLLKLASSDTGTRKPNAWIKAYANIRRVRACGSAADDLCPLDQSDRCSGCAGGEADFFQYLIKARIFYDLI